MRRRVLAACRMGDLEGDESVVFAFVVLAADSFGHVDPHARGRRQAANRVALTPRRNEPQKEQAKDNNRKKNVQVCERERRSCFCTVKQLCAPIKKNTHMLKSTRAWAWRVKEARRMPLSHLGPNEGGVFVDVHLKLGHNVFLLLQPTARAQRAKQAKVPHALAGPPLLRERNNCAKQHLHRVRQRWVINGGP